MASLRRWWNFIFNFKRSINQINLKSKTFFFVLFVLLGEHCKHKENADSFNALKQRSQKVMDTITKKINEKIRITRFADSIVEVDTVNALQKIDSLILLYPRNDRLYISRGQWYYSRKLFHEALAEFKTSESVAGHSSPLLSEKMGKTYVSLGNKEMAIVYYKDAAEFVSRFYLQVGKIYESNNLLDSALYYYSLYYFKNKPDTSMKKHMDSLSLR
jgi:tetratricopeptide (TPR) repeat protein